MSEPYYVTDDALKKINMVPDYPNSVQKGKPSPTVPHMLTHLSERSHAQKLKYEWD